MTQKTDPTPAEARALLPCPFCGNDGNGPIEDALHVCHIEDAGHVLYDRYCVQCDKCTATMGYSNSEDDAIAAWNTRLASTRDIAMPEGEGLSYEERVEYETRILAAEMEVERARRVLRPFANKATKWEANHAHLAGMRHRDSNQVQHRLGDFRAARDLANRFDRLAEGMVERPFACCCAEAGGHVNACDCVNKDHGTAWHRPAAIRSGETPVGEGRED